MGGFHKRGIRIVCGTIAAAVFMFAFPAFAQQPPPDSAGTPPKVEAKPADSSAAKDPKEASGQNKENEKNNDRIFGVIPNYLTVEGSKNVKPITPKQKLGLAWEGIKDPYAFAVAGIVSGISQARNDQPTWGQGWVGYTKRYWAQLADQSAGPLMTTFLFPSILHEDPRYFRLGTGSLRHRFKYAASRLFVARTDSGHFRFNYSEFIGNAAAAGISNLYYPRPDRNLSHNLSEYVMQILIDLLGTQLKEFWPDIHRKFFHGKQ